jgi:hypothetical protein
MLGVEPLAAGAASVATEIKTLTESIMSTILPLL